MEVVDPAYYRDVIAPNGPVSSDEKYGARALVAEDNSVNQKLIRLMLAEFGVEVDIASNGLVAFEKYRMGGYDIVFMDVNMPVMDGIEATAMILDYEKEKSLPHIPLIALTAKAIKGDRENLLAAGLDNYLAKPVSMKSLGEILSAYLQVKVNPYEGILPPFESGADTTDSAFDINKASGELGISPEIFKSIAAEFYESSQEIIAVLADCLMRDDHAGVHQAAHKLKGAAANLRFTRLAEAAREMEEQAAGGEIPGAASLFETIKKEIEFIRELL
jgi:CheY-like chemotaxis protein